MSSADAMALTCGPVHKIATFSVTVTSLGPATVAGCVWGSDAASLRVSWSSGDALCWRRSSPLRVPPACRGPIHALITSSPPCSISPQPGECDVVTVFCSTSGVVWKIQFPLVQPSSAVCERVVAVRGERIQALLLAPYSPHGGTQLSYALTAMNRLFDGEGRMVASAVHFGVAFAQELLWASIGSVNSVLCASGTYNGDVVGWIPDDSGARLVWRVALHRPGCVIMCLSVRAVRIESSVHYVLSTGSDDRSTTLAHIAPVHAQQTSAWELRWRTSGSHFAKSRIRCVDTQVLRLTEVDGGPRPHVEVLQCVGGEDGTVQTFRVAFDPTTAKGDDMEATSSLLWRAESHYPAHGCSAIALLPIKGGTVSVVHGGFDGGVFVNAFPEMPSSTTGVALSVPVHATGKIRCLVAHTPVDPTHEPIVIALTEGHYVAVGHTISKVMVVAPIFLELGDAAPSKPPCCAAVVHSAKFSNAQSVVSCVVGYLDGSVWRVYFTYTTTSLVVSSVACLHRLPTKIIHLTVADGSSSKRYACFSDATSGGVWLAAVPADASSPRWTPALRHVQGNFGAQCTAVVASIGEQCVLVVGCTKKLVASYSVALENGATDAREVPMPHAGTGALMDSIVVNWPSSSQRALVTLVSAEGCLRAWISTANAAQERGRLTWIDTVAPLAFPWSSSRVLFAAPGGDAVAAQHGTTVQVYIKSEGGVWRQSATAERVTAPRLISVDVHQGRSLLVASPNGEDMMMHVALLVVPSEGPRGAVVGSCVLQEPLVDAPDMNCCASPASGPEDHFFASPTWAAGGESTSVNVVSCGGDGTAPTAVKLCGGHTSNILGVVFVQRWLVSVGSLSTICVWEHDAELAPPWVLRERRSIDGDAGAATAGVSDAVPRYMCVAAGAAGADAAVLYVGTSAGTVELFLLSATGTLSCPTTQHTITPCENCCPRSILCLTTVPASSAAPSVRALVGDTHGRVSVMCQGPGGVWRASVAQVEAAAVTAMHVMKPTEQVTAPMLVVCGLDSGAVVLLSLTAQTSVEACPEVQSLARIQVAATPVRSLLLSTPQCAETLLHAVADGVVSTVRWSGVSLTVERQQYLPCVRGVSQAALLTQQGEIVVVGQGQCVVDVNQL